MDPLADYYTLNSTYSAQHDGTFWLLSDAAGWGVALDEPAYRIWSSFDGRATADIIPALQTGLGVSGAFIETTVKVLARGGLLQSVSPLPPLPRPAPIAIETLSRLPLVSIIILASRQAREHLETCLPSVLAQTYPHLEIILVDNQTTDDSVAFTRENFPQVKILSTPQPLGFGGANNLAMKQAQGEFFFLVNEDTEMDSACIAECVKVALSRETIAVVAPKMKLFYMRAFFNSMGNSIHKDAHSYDNFIGYLDVGQFDTLDQVFTVCFGAALLSRKAVEHIGYMDEDYFVYYDDVDWSLRAWIYGYEAVAAPQAVIYHKFNATVNTLASTFRLRLITYNRRRYAWKNFSPRQARKMLRVYRAEDRHNLTLAKRQQQREIVAIYRECQRRWWTALPKLSLARWRMRQARSPHYDENRTMALCAAIPRPTMYGKYPVIHAQVIRNHYMKLDIFSPTLPTAPEDAQVTSPPISVEPWSHKVRRVWKTQGPVGLLKETVRYLRWRRLQRLRDS